MKSFLKHLGLALILLGVVLFVVLHLMSLTFITKLLLMPFIMVLGGTVLYVWQLKRESKY
jgi:uncharacterized membrane protein